MTARIVASPKVDPAVQVLRSTPRDDYERAVTRIYEIMQAPDVMQQICARWFPTHGPAVADAYLAWRDKHADFLDETRDRMHAIWVSQGEGNVRVVRVVEYFTRRERYETYMRDFDATPAREFEQKCIEYPQVLNSDAWNLPRRFERELVVIRERPRPAPIGAPPPGR